MTADKPRPINEPVSLRYKTARAALTSGAVEFVTRAAAVVLSIATARTLEPREVGLLGLAVIVTGIISMIGCYPEMAAVALPGREKHGRYAVAAFIIRMQVLILLFCLLMLTFPVCAELLSGKEGGGQQLGQIVQILLLGPVLELFSGYPQVILQRQLDLSYLATINLLQPAVFIGLAVPLLLNGYGYIGVAWASLAGTAVVTVMLWARLLSKGWGRIEGWPERGEWREVCYGSLKLFTGGFGGYLGSRLDNLLVAGALGPTAMSYYSMAWNASRAPSGIFAKAIISVLVPVLARIGDDPVRVQRAVRDSLRHSYLLLTPICASVFVAAPSLVSVVLGDKWLPIVPGLRVMCFAVLTGPLLDTSYSLLISTGRAQMAAFGTGVRIALLILTMQPFVHRWGIVGAAYSDLLSALGLTFCLYIVVKVSSRGVELGVVSALAIPVASAALAGVIAWAAGSFFTDGVARLMGEAVFFLAAYPTTIALLGGRDRLSELAGLIKGMLPRTTLASA